MYDFEWVADKEWADSYESGIRVILDAHHALMGSFRRGDAVEDMRHGTDYVQEAKRVAVAARMRSFNVKVRDFTIRYQRGSGARTEYQKMLDGDFEADFYFYGWASRKVGQIEDWLLLNVDAFRSSPLFAKGISKANRDGRTSFVYWRRATLREAGLLLCSRPQCTHVLPDSQQLALALGN